MKIKKYINFLLLLLIVSCATYKPKYAEEFSGNKVTIEQEVSHTFYLIGDAGLSPMGGMNEVLKNFKTELASAPENSTAIFLGDNIYPAGFPSKKKDKKQHKSAKNHLDAQLATLENFKGKTIFIPGNHDWYSGLSGLERQEEYIEKYLDDDEVFFPENGCPIEKIDINDDVVVIAIDTEWYLVNWDKHPTINDECEIKDREAFFEELEGLIKKNASKTTIIALHHPMFTYGSHGGQYSFKQHMNPKKGKIPVPVLGTFANVLRRTTGVTIEDQSNQKYNQLKKRIVTLAQYAEKVVFVSGHEHTLQYIVEENTPQIVSGSGAKDGAARLLNGSKFSTGKKGYAIFKVFKDGSSKVDFYGVEEGKELLFSTKVKEADKPFAAEFPKDFPAFKEASIYDAEAANKGGFYKWMWGERYRKYYATEVKAPTVRLDTLFGGLTPVRKGGGHQSKSLRLQHKDGRQFVMRALKKSVELYLQAMAFKDQYVVGEFDGTATEGLLEDFYTGSHPYAPFTVAALSDAVGIYHTNPTMYYVPKQDALGAFNVDFGDELYMIEEHVSDGHDDLASFGYAEKIEGTDDLMKKLRKDEKYRVDTKAFIRARLFDMMIGDWDRHNDQWRWAQFKEGKDSIVFRPIPRDRDQPYSIMGDGALMEFATRAIPGLRLFEGFREEIRSVKGFNASPKTFALDMALLPETTLNHWIEEAEYIQKNIDADVITTAFKAFPPEVRGTTTENIKKVLLARKKNLVHTAIEYFKILNKNSVITGTDSDDYFEIIGLPDGKLAVKAFRIKDGEKGTVIFNKVYDPKHTKEIWVYGLDDDDVYYVQNTNGKIKIRLIGGQNNDTYKIAKKSKGVQVYDFKTKKNDFEKAFAGRLHKTNDYDINTYRFLNIKANTFQFLPTLGGNPDDGIKIGALSTFTKNSFQYTQQHNINAAFYFATSGFEAGYKGEFANVMGKASLELNAGFTSPNFAVNFFGFGNETLNNDDDEPLELDFNRVKIRTLKFAPSLVWRGDLGSEVRLGASYEDYQVEETEGRFIETFYANNPMDNEQTFVGLHSSYNYSNTDNAAYPTIGMHLLLEGGYKINLNESDRSFAYFSPSLSIDHKITSNGRLVFATKAKSHFNFGDDFEFYQAASIGADDGLRGFRNQRFSGKTSFYQNSDLRYSFRRRTTGILPVTPGIYAGFDYGRVWLPNDDSEKWHNSYGAGFFVNGSNILSASLALFNSTDGVRFSFGVGFGF